MSRLFSNEELIAFMKSIDFSYNYMNTHTISFIGKKYKINVQSLEREIPAIQVIVSRIYDNKPSISIFTSKHFFEEYLILLQNEISPLDKFLEFKEKIETIPLERGFGVTYYLSDGESPYIGIYPIESMEMYFLCFRLVVDPTHTYEFMINIQDEEMLNKLYKKIVDIHKTKDYHSINELGNS